MVEKLKIGNEINKQPLPIALNLMSGGLGGPIAVFRSIY